MSARQQAPRLPFFALLGQGFGDLLRNFIPFLKVAAFPFVIEVVGRKAITAFSPTDLTSVLALFLDRAAMTLFGMAWLGVLLAPGSLRRYWLPRWHREHWLFLLYSLVIVGLDLATREAIELLDLHPASIDELLRLVLFSSFASLPVFYVHACLSLTFCALAVGQQGSLLWSWRLLGRSTLKLMAVVWLVSLCFSFVMAFAGAVVVFLGQSGISMLPIVIWLGYVDDYLRYAIILGAFATAFRHFTGWVPPPDRTILERFE